VSFVEKHLAEIRIASEVAVQTLYGDESMRSRTLFGKRHVDRRHATRRELENESVWTYEFSGQRQGAGRPNGGNFVRR
jgi:hypothetical protein